MHVFTKNTAFTPKGLVALRIHYYDGDNCHELAKSFCQKYGLERGLAQILAAGIETSKKPGEFVYTVPDLYCYTWPNNTDMYEIWGKIWTMKWGKTMKWGRIMAKALKPTLSPRQATCRNAWRMVAEDGATASDSSENGPCAQLICLGCIKLTRWSQIGEMWLNVTDGWEPTG